MMSEGSSFSVYQCPDMLQQEVMSDIGKQEIDITFSSLCPRHLNDKCRYRCPANYVPLYDTLLTCTNVGWDLESKTLCEGISLKYSVCADTMFRK